MNITFNNINEASINFEDFDNAYPLNFHGVFTIPIIVIIFVVMTIICSILLILLYFICHPIIITLLMIFSLRQKYVFIKTSIASQNKTNIIETDCYICLCPIDTNVEIYDTCHSYHKDCLEKWCAINPCCPLCRTPIKVIWKLIFC
jgi:hypothetical protein